MWGKNWKTKKLVRVIFEEKELLKAGGLAFREKWKPKATLDLPWIFSLGKFDFWIRWGKKFHQTSNIWPQGVLDTVPWECLFPTLPESLRINFAKTYGSPNLVFLHSSYIGEARKFWVYEGVELCLLLVDNWGVKWAKGWTWHSTTEVDAGSRGFDP